MTETSITVPDMKSSPQITPPANAALGAAYGLRSRSKDLTHTWTPRRALFAPNKSITVKRPMSTSESIVCGLPPEQQQLGAEDKPQGAAYFARAGLNEEEAKQCRCVCLLGLWLDKGLWCGLPPSLPTLPPSLVPTIQ